MEIQIRQWTQNNHDNKTKHQSSYKSFIKLTTIKLKKQFYTSIYIKKNVEYKLLVSRLFDVICNIDY